MTAAEDDGGGLKPLAMMEGSVAVGPTPPTPRAAKWVPSGWRTMGDRVLDLGGCRSPPEKTLAPAPLPHGLDGAVRLLEQTIEEEKATDQALTELATSVVNLEAEEEEDA